MLLALIYAVATLFAPKGGFGKAVLLLNALIIFVCFKVAAKWSALPPEYNEWGMRQQSPDQCAWWALHSLLPPTPPQMDAIRS